MSKTSPTNYRLPAEFEPQEATWLSWPSNKEACPKTYLRLQDKFGEIAANLARYQRVRINAPDRMHMGIRLSIADNEGDLSQVDLYDHPTNDVWCRDHGPIFIKHNDTGKCAVANFKFNAWGEKFPPYDLDAGIAAKAAEVLKGFFDSNKPKAFAQVHKGQSRENSDQYCIGNLTATAGNYRVYLYLKVNGANISIQEMRFDKE